MGENHCQEQSIGLPEKKKPLLFTETLDEYGEVVWEPKETDISVLPEDALDQKDTSEIFSEILDSIPEKQRLVITMYYYMEMSQPHIARTLGISEGTVKSRLSYGKKAIESNIRSGKKGRYPASYSRSIYLLPVAAPEGRVSCNGARLEYTGKDYVLITTGRW